MKKYRKDIIIIFLIIGFCFFLFQSNESGKTIKDLTYEVDSLEINIDSLEIELLKKDTLYLKIQDDLKTIEDSIQKKNDEETNVINESDENDIIIKEFNDNEHIDYFNENLNKILN